MSAFHYFLKIFYDVTVCLSSVYYSTSHHTIYKLYEITNQFVIHRVVSIFANTVVFMENKFNKYWEIISTLYCIAGVIDPRIKSRDMDSLMHGIGQKLNLDLNISIDNVRGRMITMFEYYNRKYESTSRTRPTTSTRLTNTNYTS